MKPLPTKAQIRLELEQQIQSYLQDGGQVHSIPKGISGQDDNRNIFGQMGAMEPKQSRTPLNGVVQALDARRQQRHATVKKKRPRKKLITDDFGEPLRWIWVDE